MKIWNPLKTLWLNAVEGPFQASPSRAWRWSNVGESSSAPLGLKFRAAPPISNQVVGPSLVVPTSLQSHEQSSVQKQVGHPCAINSHGLAKDYSEDCTTSMANEDFNSSICSSNHDFLHDNDGSQNRSVARKKACSYPLFIFGNEKDVGKKLPK